MTSSRKCFVKSFDENFPLEIHFECRCRVHKLSLHAHFCRISNGGGAVIFGGRNLPQQTIYHWKGNLSKSPIHYKIF